ncbi:S8 family serine peptidase [Natronomonas marina]|uniref:S8 family serine peptidase n=1 Tax=Natronomonas marina TaxID=2961939 RepID=UPI0020C9F378|nr:S8 family serine peptidase [Natronomonas marina]
MTDDSKLSRRTFLKGVGATAIAAAADPALGAETAGGLDERFLNWRAVEARKVWDRGFRGRRDRTLALTDSGVEGRHPDLGPWNGVRAEIEDGEFSLVRGDDGSDGGGGAVPEFEPVTGPDGEPLTESDSGTFTPGAFVAPNQQLSEVRGATFTAKTTSKLDASLSWTPPGNDLEFRIDNVTDERTEVGRVASANNPEELLVDVTEGEEYQFVIELYASVAGQYTVEATYVEAVSADAGTETSTADVTDVDPFADLSHKTFGWYDAGSRYGSFDKPRDQNGHGTHVSSIMAGSGRASTLEESTVHEENATLLPGDFREYEVEASAGRSVWASAFGSNINLYIIDEDGQELDQSPVRKDSIILEHPIEEDGTYTVQVRPRETDTVVEGVGEQAQAGNPTAGTLERIAVGTTKLPAEATGEAAAASDDAETALHPGVAPNAGVVGLQGLGTPTADLGTHAEAFKEAFNIRSVNMSWGPLAGAPLGQVEQLDSTRADVRRITEGGILVCASAGNFFTPANGNGGPAAADEAISVVATGPFDGIATYSSGGIGGIDEQSDPTSESSPVYAKPDVTAPGGDISPDALANIALGLATNPPAVPVPEPPVGISYPIPSNYELARAAKNGSPEKTYGDADGRPDSGADEPFAPRDYTDKAGTSMSSPYVNGVAGLLAEAMEFGRPDGGERPEAITLPEPAETTESDVYRLKALLLATASESVFTAAPYHVAQNPPKAPTYDFGGRDPFEGFGRVNPDAAVDAVTRDLTPELTAGSDDDPTTGASTTEETLGLYVPEDSRATAGYVTAPTGSMTVSVDLSHLSGGNKGKAAGDPHVDLFVYDPASPSDRGEPTIVARGQGLTGAPSVSVTVPETESGEKTYVVVAKLVNVPGVVNGHDVQSHFDLTVELDATGESFAVSGGARTGDGTLFTAGQTNRMTVEVTDPDEAAVVRDVVPGAWEVLEQFSEDVDRVEQPTDGGPKYVYFDSSAATGETTSYTYFVEAPDTLADSGQYQFGPAEAAPAAEADDPETTFVAVPNTSSTVGVIGIDTNDPTGSLPEAPGGDPPEPPTGDLPDGSD